MATTGIHSITLTLNYAIEYICQDYKTDNGRLIQSYACSPRTAAAEMLFTQKIKGTGQNKILGHHLYQSFRPGEVTPEQAMKIGKELADKLLKGQYEYVIATHIDREHIHNHIIFNSVNMVTGRTFETEQNRNKKVYWKIRKISDEICKEFGLSVVQNAELNKGKSWYEWDMEQQGKSYKARIKNDIDDVVKTAKNFDDFINKMSSLGYTVNNDGKYLKFKAPEQQRFIRAKTLGYYYTEEKLKERILKRTVQKARNREFMQSLDLPNIIDTSAEKYNNGDGLEYWARLRNMQNAAKILNYFSDRGITNLSDLETTIDTMHEQRITSKEQITQLEKQVNTLQFNLRNIKAYNELKPLYGRYKASKNKDKFFFEHEKDIIFYEGVVQELRAVYGSNALPKEDKVEKEIKKLKTKIDRLYKEYRQSKNEAFKLEKMRQQLDRYMNNVDNSRGKDTPAR